jgi:Zn finger protein HypA/HybF involved in hydrogenase expression
VDIVKKIFADKKKRNIFILSIIAIILFIMMLVNLLFRQQNEPFPEGAILVVTCSECGFQDVRRIKNINDRRDARNRCPKCGGKFVKTLKCLNCDKVFPYQPQVRSFKGEKWEKLTQLRNSMQCPNCQSMNVRWVSPKEIKKKK